MADGLSGKRLKEAVNAYLSQIKRSTPQERGALRRWLKDGNGAYSNPWELCDERGRPLGFLTARRYIESHRLEDYEIYALYNYGEEDDDIDIPDEDLPFK